MALLYKRLFEMLWLQESRIELWLHSLVQIDGSRDEPNIPLLTWLELLLASLELAELILWLFNLVWKGARKVRAALSSLVFTRTRDFSFLTSILSAVCSSLRSLNPAQLFATKTFPLYPWSTPTQPWLLLRASLLAGWAQLQGTLGLCAGHRGGSEELFMDRESLHITAGSGKQQNNLWILQLFLMSVLHLPQARRESFRGLFKGLFLKLSLPLPLVCFYFSSGSWSVISFLTPGALSCRALSDSVSDLVLGLQEADPSCCTLWCLPPVRWPQASAKKSFMGRGFNFFTVWGCLQLFCTCSNLLVHHPHSQRGFCVHLVLWSAQLLCLKSQINVKPN